MNLWRNILLKCFVSLQRKKSTFTEFTDDNSGSVKAGWIVSVPLCFITGHEQWKLTLCCRWEIKSKISSNLEQNECKFSQSNLILSSMQRRLLNRSSSADILRTGFLLFISGTIQWKWFCTSSAREFLFASSLCLYGSLFDTHILVRNKF